LVFRVNARTVLELGSELISSDIIAFYELIKNAFDAGSATGAVISFEIVLRRNVYLRLVLFVTDVEPRPVAEAEVEVGNEPGEAEPGATRVGHAMGTQADLSG
jgi:hypothetical protein